MKEIDKLFYLVNSQFDGASALWRTIEIDKVFKNMPTLRPDSLMLDLGCGEGNIANIVFPYQNKIGLDNFHEFLIEAKEKGFYSYLVEADATYMPFVNGSFDLIFSNSVLEHIPGLKGVLKGAANVAKKNGLLMFTVPSKNLGKFFFFYRFFKKVGLTRLADWYATKRNALLNHFNLFSQKEWEDFLKPLGFEIVSADYYLCKNTISAWDLIAALQFALNKVQMPNFANFVIKRLSKFLFFNFVKRWEPRSLSEDETAGLLIIAKKI